MALLGTFRVSAGISGFLSASILMPGSMSRLIVVQRIGGCGEFALAVVTLLSDAAGLYTRKA